MSIGIRGGWLAAAAAACALSLCLGGCDRVTNSPYPRQWLAGNVFFTSFNERPKYLDPVSSYSNVETPWMWSVYEPPLQFNYLKRPYTLEPRTLTAMPEIVYLDKDGRRLPEDATGAQVAASIYTLHLIPGIVYQPHPALARDASGRYLYQDLTPQQIEHRFSIDDFPLAGAATSTRELTADDYVYEIKRLASPYVPTPSAIYGLMVQYIEGLKDLGDRLRAERERALAGHDPRDQYLPWRDLREVPFSGARALDRYTLQIRLVGKYPQFRYWLQMSFFSPIPWEADRFYAQRGMADNALTLNFWPIGTGPFLLAEQGPNRYLLKRNPNFRLQRYPTEGMPGDAEKGLLADAGKPLPFLDMIVFSKEKESEPEEVKFLQGYYDAPEVERLDRVFKLQKELMDHTGRAKMLTDHGIQFDTRIDPNMWYMGFNWLDPVVGKGDTPQQQERNRKLRQAISIATDWEEYAAIFIDKNGPSQVAMGPVPPGLFGYRGGREGINPITHVWVDGHPQRRPLADAKRLLAEAGYPEGRDAKSGLPLVLYYDTTGAGPGSQDLLDWHVKQMAKLGIQLVVRATDYNRFQERTLKGAHQIFFWGWLADYPDPEDFLFLLYGPQARSRSQGENTANYENPEYDRLYNVMKDLPDGPQRQAAIDRMIDIARDDAVWMWGIFPASTAAFQPWVRNGVATFIINDKLKYLRVDPELRMQKIREWNQPQWWPVPLMLLAVLLVFVPSWWVWRERERRDARTALVWNAR